MRTGFRFKLAAIVATAAVAVAALVVAGMLTDQRARQQLGLIEKHYLPQVELGPRLTLHFTALRRGMQDAVTAQDRDALLATRAQRDRFVAELRSHRERLGAEPLERLRRAVDDYYATAFEVSSRLLRGEGSEQLVDSISIMQAQHARTLELLDEASAFEPDELQSAFRATRETWAGATRVRSLVSAVCLLLLLALSIMLSHSVLRSLSALRAGLARFGTSDFTKPIVVTARDELGDVAQQANVMATSLQRLSEERDYADWIKGAHATLALELRGELEPEDAGRRAVSALSTYLGALAGALFYEDRRGELSLQGKHGVEHFVAPDAALDEMRALVRPLVGPDASSESVQVHTEPSAHPLRVHAEHGVRAPRVIVLVPLVHHGHSKGVLVFVLLDAWPARNSEALLSVRETATIALEAALARRSAYRLLRETQELAARLSEREEELRATNEALRVQQEELQQSNEELTEQAELLGQQRQTLERKNLELDTARAGLETKAQELAEVSGFKSQFLANMSHELRTPLNSILLLSELLARNDSRKLDEKQVEYCRTIHDAGADLLALINQILDLSKIEAGKQEVRLETVSLASLAEQAERRFGPLARAKRLQLRVDVAPDVPATITSDRGRVAQIITNLLGNAIKFTPRGQVSLCIERPPAGVRLQSPLRPERTVALRVTDTGIGIEAADQERIFAPFQQLDANTDRSFGGTGLGLAIVRELCALLGGELRVQSAKGQGSSFTCFLPEAGPVVRTASAATVTAPRALAAAPMARAAPTTPTTPSRPNGVLVVEADVDAADTLVEQLHAAAIDALSVRDSRAASEALAHGTFSCVVLDLGPSDPNALHFLCALRRQSEVTRALPVLVYTARTPEPAEMQVIERHAQAFVPKDRASGDRLVQEIRAQLRAASAARPGLEQAAEARSDLVVHLQGTKVLVADDDMRTVYALSAILEARGAQVFVAETGSAALRVLDAQPDLSLVLMDLMMPEMDGYEAMQRIRRDPRFATLPIVVLTAKAMAGERERCLQAGATDYLTKPVSFARLDAVLHAQLPVPAPEAEPHVPESP